MNAKVKHVLDNLPSKPGVYFMKDNQGEIIYIGKAKNLKNRVSSYFSSTKKNLKTELLVSNIHDIDYVLASSEEDAFSLESNLIKENQPKYNILLKDDKLFPYIRINKKERFPMLTVVRRVKNDGALYFGPFVTGMRVSEFISIIKEVFPVRQCKINFDKTASKKRMCLFGDMGKCSGPCVGNISNEEYLKVIDEVIDFLNGKTGTVKRLLQKRMDECSEALDFEEAIILRDQLEMIERSEKYILSNLAKDENVDAFAISSLDEFVCVNINCIRNGKTILDKNILLDIVDSNLEETLANFLIQYYDGNILPHEILVNIEIDPFTTEILKEVHGKSVEIRVPKIGTKKKIIDVAIQNTIEHLHKNIDVQKVKREMERGALKELQAVLGLNEIPDRIECYDISNISGTNSVASMVVFEDGAPKKKEYRKFKIKTVEGPNDFLSLEETLRRRLKRLIDGDKNFKRPDLIVIDGGLGQLHAVARVLAEMNEDIPVISIAKQDEEIFTLNSNESIKLSPSSNARKLIQRLRDEAHRFAITFHRELRDKNAFK